MHLSSLLHCIFASFNVKVALIIRAHVSFLSIEASNLKIPKMKNSSQKQSKFFLAKIIYDMPKNFSYVKCDTSPKSATFLLKTNINGPRTSMKRSKAIDPNKE